MDNIAWQPIGGHDLEKCSAFSIFAAKKTHGKCNFMMIKRSIGSQATNNIVRMDLRIRAEISESFEESKKLDKVEIKDDLRFEIGFNEAC